MTKIKNSERVTIITVTHNSMRVISAMLSSVPSGARVIVIDNLSNDLKDLRDLCSQLGVLLIENSFNEGFGAACNRGAKLATTEFLLFLNPDSILMADTLDELIAAAQRNPTATGFNPRIERDDGKPSFNYKSPLLPRSEWMDTGWPKADCEVSTLSGCAMFVRRIDFVALAGFDANIFLFHEDDDLALRLRKRGPLVFVYDARVCHSVGSSSGNGLEVVTFKEWHLGYSRVYTMRKHSIAFAFTRSLTRAVLKAASPIVLFSRRKRARRWSFLQGVVSAFLDTQIRTRK
tara:strand:+ start:1765 stop:2634 length:870 start_codon:yes stop_codon:yes gene_type:complete